MDSQTVTRAAHEAMLQTQERIINVLEEAVKKENATTECLHTRIRNLETLDAYWQAHTSKLESDLAAMTKREADASDENDGLRTRIGELESMIDGEEFEAMRADRDAFMDEVTRLKNAMCDAAMRISGIRHNTDGALDVLRSALLEGK